MFFRGLPGFLRFYFKEERSSLIFLDYYSILSYYGIIFYCYPIFYYRYASLLSSLWPESGFLCLMDYFLMFLSFFVFFSMLK